MDQQILRELAAKVSTTNLTRRGFISASIAAGGGLLLSISWPRSARDGNHVVGRWRLGSVSQ